VKVADGIHRIDTPLGERVNSLYLIRGDDGAVLFDTGVDGTAQQHLQPYLEENGIDPETIRWVFVSHADVDHFGGLSSMRELLPHAVYGCHRDDAALIESYEVFETRRARNFREPWGLDEDPEVLAWTREVTRESPVDVQVVGGERLRLSKDREVEIVHAPGHSRGHLSLWDSATRSLIVSDAVLADSVRLADGSPAFPPTYRFVDEYVSTVARFEAMAPELLLTAHYPTMRGDEALSFLATSRNFAEALERTMQDVVEATGDQGIALRPLLEALNPRIGTWPQDGTIGALAFPVVGHLERALATGRMELIDGDPTRVRASR